MPSGSQDQGEIQIQVPTNVQNVTNVPKSILEPQVLKHLQRELTYEIVDLEFDKTVI